MSTLVQMRTEVLARGFDSTTYSTRVDTFINRAGRTISRRIRERLGEATSTITTSSGTATSAIGSSILRVRSVKDEADDYNLEFFEDLAEFDELDNTTTGRPTAYTIDGTNIRFWPVPDGTYTLTLRYWTSWTALSSDSDTPTLIPPDWHHLLEHYALAEAYLSEDDPEMHGYYLNLFETEFRLMAVDLQDQSEDGPVRVPGMWNDYWVPDA